MNPVKSIFYALLSIFTFKQSTDTTPLSFSPTDQAYNYTFQIPQDTYHRFCKNIYSQNGEDGILEKILSELRIYRGTFCEFGASDGLFSSNTFNLLKNHGFSGIAIEADPQLYAKCVQHYASFSRVKVFHGTVIYNNPAYDLNAWLAKGKLPHDFDVLSIDIDGHDYFVWQNLTDYKPKIVILEINPYRDPIYEELPGQISSEYNNDLLKAIYPRQVAAGCSFMSAIKLGLKKGYIPVSFTGNIIFIRKDLISQLKDFPYIISDNPYDYISLYTHLVLWGNTWKTNTLLILNVAIRDYYMQFKTKYIDVTWLNKRISQIMQNGK
jgi:hypothetical protein